MTPGRDSDHPVRAANRLRSSYVVTRLTPSHLIFPRRGRIDQGGLHELIAVGSDGRQAETEIYVD
jgi:hypothetical protein